MHRTGYVDNIDSVPLALNMPYTDELMARIAAVPHVTGVTGRIQFNGLVCNGLAQTMFVGRGVDVTTRPRSAPAPSTTSSRAARPLARATTPRRWWASSWPQSFEVAAGQDGGAADARAPSGRANSMDLTVQGLSTSAFPFENKRVMTRAPGHRAGAAGPRGPGHRVRGRASTTSTGLDEVAAALREALGPDYEVHTWRELQPFLRDIIARQNFMLGRHRPSCSSSSC